MNENKKMLILGAGNAQIDLIEYCRAHGIETYGVSYTNTDPGIPMLDHFRQINILDMVGVKEYAEENAVDFVYSVGSDIAVPVFCKVSEETGRKIFISAETADICCNKQLMRNALGRDNPCNLPYLFASTLEEALVADFFPMIIKPVDSQGQRGVFRVDSAEDIKKRFHDSIGYSKSHTVILERFVDGNEVSVNAYMRNGKCIFALLSDRKSFDEYPGGVIKKHILPSIYANTDTEKKILDTVEQSLNRLGIKNGPAYFQIKVEYATGSPYIIEVTPRLDGCHMWKLIRLYCGVDLLDACMKHLITGDPGELKNHGNLVPAKTEFICEPPGTTFEEAKHPSYEADIFKLYCKTGDTVKKMNGFMEKCGYRMHRIPQRIALIGGSGVIGREYKKIYGPITDVLDISRQAGNISDYTEAEISKAAENCTAMVILAGKKVHAAEEQSYQLYEDNVRIAEESMKSAANLGIKNVVYISSRCVYGDSSPSPVGEETPISPINFYGISKYAGELVCQHYARKNGIHLKVLRLSQVLSLGAENMVSVFIKNAAANIPISVKANVSRDYLDIRDACRGITAALVEGMNRSGTYNLGSGRATSVHEVAMAVKEAYHGNVEVLEEIPANAASASFFLSMAKPAAELGFKCKYSLSDSIQYLAFGESER